MDVLIRATDLSKSIEGKLLFENTSFEVSENDCIGVIGPNGCGKTTLFRILLRQVKAFDGELWIKENLRIRILKQTAINMQDLTIRQFITQITDENRIQQQIIDYEKQLENPAIYNSPKYEEILDKIQKLQISISQAKSNSRLKAVIGILEDISLGELSLEEKIGSALSFNDIKYENSKSLALTYGPPVVVIEWPEEEVRTYCLPVHGFL